MSVCRVEKIKDFTIMGNYHLRDKRLSLKSKGLLSLVLSLPEDWNYTIRGLVKICREGVDCIGATLKELEKNGYIERNILRDERGRITDTEYIFKKNQKTSRVRLSQHWRHRIRKSRIRKNQRN